MGGADKRTRWRMPTLGRHSCGLWAGEYVRRRGEGGETIGGRTDSVQVNGRGRKRQYPAPIFGGTWWRRTGGPWRAFLAGAARVGGGTVGRGEKAGAFLYVRVGRARFQSMYSKKVKRSAFQKHHTALCNEARYHIGGITRQPL